MSKIHNVGLNLEHKIANPFKTSRNITTPNPFENSNFEGNCLPLFAADVFEGTEIKKASKLKMISSSVMGSVNKLHSSITEPIVNFVKRVGSSISNAWDYAKNTNISDIAGIKRFSDSWNNTMNMDILDISKNMSSSLSNSVSGLGHHISDKMSFLNKDVLEIKDDIKNDLSSKWYSLINSISKNRISKDSSVEDLRLMWENEINSASEREVA